MPLGTFSKLPRESLRALYYKLGGTDDISDLRTRRALLKKIYEVMGNDPADLDNMHRASSVLQKISEVASVGGKYVGVDISDAQPLDSSVPNSKMNPLVLSSAATAEINAILSAGKIPIFEANSEARLGLPVLGDSSGYGVSADMEPGSQGWFAYINFRVSPGGHAGFVDMYCQSWDFEPDEHISS